MPPSMAPNALPLLFLFLLLLISTDLFLKASASDVPTRSTGISAFSCSDNSIKTCTSLLYQHNDLNKEQIALFYCVNSWQIIPITHGKKHNYLVSVPCSCKQVNGSDGLTVGYFYDTSYTVRPNDTFVNVSSLIYSAQAWEVGGEEKNYTVGNEVPVHLLCGCVEDESQVIVTYTVQQYDTLSDIAVLLSSTIEGMEDLNSILKQNPGYIDVGWVLFVPMDRNGVPEAPQETAATKGHKWPIIISILSAVTLLSMSMLAIVLVMRRRNRRNIEEDPKAVSMTMSSRRTLPFQSQSLNKETMQDVIFESERPIIYNLEEIEEATSGFDESKKIGVGGYGSVYFGILGDKEVAVKKMRSNKSKEFLAELKVLCRIHHINVVELLGYASGDDHLYLVYEFITNGSLSDHLHDPLLKGRQPLSWTARTQIALDAAKGIEYIHDHTKTRYVHRDIKTSNILLDEELRAKVADFGLAKLVGRTSEDDFIATRLVGTPGYLPPESVKELQVTTKTDVFAFGVVLAELITGQRALIRDNQEPTRMKSLITLISEIFQDEDPGTALESIIDVNLHQSYPIEQVYKMAELAGWCLSEDAVNRPEMREGVVALSQIAVSSVEWEASLGGDSQVFSGVFIGR